MLFKKHYFVFQHKIQIQCQNSFKLQQKCIDEKLLCYIFLLERSNRKYFLEKPILLNFGKPWPRLFGIYIFCRLEKSLLVLKLIFTATDLKEGLQIGIFQKALFCTLASRTNLILKSVQIATDLFLLKVNTLLYQHLISFGVPRHFNKVNRKRGTFRQSYTKHFLISFHFNAVFASHTN